MVYLIDMQLTLEPSSQPVLSSLSFLLLAATYHSSLPSLLYALYGTNYDSSSPSAPFASYFLLVYNSTSRSTLSNTTFSLPGSTHCSITATSWLFRLQTNNLVLLYSMQSDQVTVNTSAVLLSRTKSFSYSPAFTYKCSDAFKSMFVYSDGSYLYFIKSSGGTAPTSIYFAIPTTVNILDMTITDSYALITWATSGSTSISVILIPCVSCIFNYAYTSGTTMSTSMYRTLSIAATATSWVRIARTDPSYSTNSSTAFWLLIDSTSSKKLIDTATFLTTSNVASLSLGSLAKMVANSNYVILTNSSSSIFVGNYSLSSPSVQSILPDSSTTVSLAAISNDSQRVALHYQSNPYSLKLYMLVQNCSEYTAQLQGEACLCLEYQANSLCKSVDSITTKQKGSELPVPSYGLALIGIVGAIAVVAVAVLVYRCWVKQATEGRRKAWKYNAKQLMSFDV